MYQVGTQAGVVNKQRQGTGLATVLQDTEQADDYFLKYMDARATAAQKKAAEKEAAKNAALGKIMNVNPEYFYKHQQEVADQVKRVQELGVLAMQSGANDPAVGSDPYSVEYQKELNRLNQMSRVSTQVRDQFKAFQQDVQAKGADYFDPETITAWDAYANTSLNDFMTNPLSPPIVKQKTPYQDSLVMAGTLADTITKGLQEGVQADPATIRGTVREFFADAKDGGIRVKSAAQTFANLPDERQKQLEERAIQYGISGPEQMLIEMTDAQIKDPTPYNPAEAITKAKFEISTSGTKGAEKFWEGPNKEASMRSANSEAYRLLNEKPDAFPAWAKYYNMEQGALTEKEFREQVQRKIAADLWDRAKKDTESGVVPGSGANPEQQKRSADWLKTVFGDNMVQAQQALDLIRGIDYGQGLTIDRAEIVQRGPNDNNRYVTFNLKGDIKSKFTKEDLADAFGIDPKAITEKGPAKDLQSGQYEQEIEIRVSPTNANFLQTFYNDAEKSKRVWMGTQNLPQYFPAQDVETVIEGRQVDFLFPDQVQQTTPKQYKYK